MTFDDAAASLGIYPGSKAYEDAKKIFELCTKADAPPYDPYTDAVLRPGLNSVGKVS